MFRRLFFATLVVTLALNIIFLFATKDKPPDPAAASTTLVSVIQLNNRAPGAPSSSSSSRRPHKQPASHEQPAAGRRLFLRSNDFYDYSPALVMQAAEQPARHLATRRPRDRGNERADATPAERRAHATPDSSEGTRTNNIEGATRSGGGDPAPVRPPRANNKSSNGNEGTHPGEITAAPTRGGAPQTPTETTANTLSIRVKSSKNHVLIKVDDLIIYESGGARDNANGAKRHPAGVWKQQDKRVSPEVPEVTAFSRRRARHLRAGARSLPDNRDANASAPLVGHGTAAKRDQQDPLAAPCPEAQRGIHVLVLNQFEGFVMSRRVFDTYSPQQDDELALYLSQIQAGRLLVLAVQDEGSFKMGRSSQARKLIERSLGSRLIHQLGWRDMWALVAVKQVDLQLDQGPASGPAASEGANLAEGLEHSAGFGEWARPVELEASFRLATGASSHQVGCQRSAPGEPAEVRARRRHFCARIEGYGPLCDCQHPSQLHFGAATQTPANSSERLREVPIVVIASDRPHYLYRMLRSLLQARGVRPAQIVVFIDGFYQEPKEVCRLFGLRYHQQRPLGERSARISHHYKASLTRTFRELFPSSQFAIILEEDLDVAPDALEYFAQTLPLLESDASLYCSSAWNDQGYEHSARDLRQLMRIETMPGLGWLLARRLFLDELEPNWPSAGQQHDWDMWIRTAAVRRGRECVIPEVSRTYHFGSTGTNINSYFQRQYFSKHAFSGHLGLAAGEPVEFRRPSSLEARAYERAIEGLVGSPERRLFSQTPLATADQSAGGLFVMSSEALCLYAANSAAPDSTASHATNLKRANGPATRGEPDPEGAKPNVIFIKMIDSEDFKNWLHLAKCWRLWDLDARGQHKSMWRLHLNGRPTLVVGHPASPYGKFKPARLLPYDF